MEIRKKLLEATARVFAETGYRGATTRRIAEEAGVSEITLFRHFGSKDALIRDALHHADHVVVPKLPAEPVDPAAELTRWTRAQFDALYAARSIIRKVMGEIEEHPEMVRFGLKCPQNARRDLNAYIGRLRARGLARADVDAEAAAAMLLGVMFAEAMTRDAMPKAYGRSAEEAMAAYIALLLRAIGAPAARSDSDLPKQAS